MLFYTHIILRYLLYVLKIKKAMLIYKVIAQVRLYFTYVMPIFLIFLLQFICPWYKSGRLFLKKHEV